MECLILLFLKVKMRVSKSISNIGLFSKNNVEISYKGGRQHCKLET
jgi:hypothetical protein